MRDFVRVFRGRRNGIVRNCAIALTGAAVALAPFAACAAGDGEGTARTALENAMRKALSSSAAWRMERTLPGSGRTFVSSGTVDCRAGGTGIEWRTETPVRSLVAMRKDAMVFEDEDGRREKAADEMPHYSEIREATDAFAAGRFDAFDGVFDIEISPAAGGGWRAVFRPRIHAMRGLVESVEIEGGELPETVTMKSGNGAVSRIRFREKRPDAK